jgi:hypothetical protein
MFYFTTQWLRVLESVLWIHTRHNNTDTSSAFQILPNPMHEKSDIEINKLQKQNDLVFFPLLVIVFSFRSW